MRLSLSRGDGTGREATPHTLRHRHAIWLAMEQKQAEERRGPDQHQPNPKPEPTSIPLLLFSDFLLRSNFGCDFKPATPPTPPRRCGLAGYRTTTRKPSKLPAPLGYLSD